MIAEFLKKFGDIKIDNVEKVGKEYYQQTPQLKKLAQSLHDYPTSAGLFLGKIEKNFFIPSPNILEIIYTQCNRVIILDEKSAWLFVCGRDVFGDGVLHHAFGKGFVIVLNERREVLGVANKEGKQYTNIYDIGMLLRREQTKKKFNKK